MPEARLTERNRVVVLKNLAQREGLIMQAAKTGLARGMQLTIGVVQKEYLQGPRPAKLGEVTTRLRQSIASRIIDTPRGSLARLGTNVVYGAFHEFGFHGPVNVRGFTRVIGQINAKGEEIDTRTKRNRSRKGTAGRQSGGMVFVQFVRAHQRILNYSGRPFIRPAVKKNEPIILAEIKKELDKVP